MTTLRDGPVNSAMESVRVYQLPRFPTVEGCVTIICFMIGVYGATGMLGRLVTARIDRAGGQAALIGRSHARLSTLAPAGSSHHTAVAAIDDAGALERALEGCSVLVN